MSRVRGGAFWEKRVRLTVGNASFLMIDRLCGQAEKEDIAVVGL